MLILQPGSRSRGRALAAAEEAILAALDSNSKGGRRGGGGTFWRGQVAALEALALLHDYQGRTEEALATYQRAEQAAVAQRGGTAGRALLEGGGLSLEALTNWGGFLDQLGDTARAHKCLVAGTTYAGVC